MLTLIAITTCALLNKPNPTDGAATEIEYVTREDTLREYKTDHEVWALKWSQDWQLNSDYSFLLTRHQRENNDYGTEEYFLIYLKLKRGYVLITELHTEGYIENTNMFWWTLPVPPHEKIPLISVQSRMPGTGHYTTQYLYTFAELPSSKELEEAADLATVLPQVIQKVKYVPPPAPLKVKLEKGQGFWKGDFTSFGADGFFFTNYIYNHDDANCCPSGDKVSGTFKLVKEKLPEIKSYGPIKVEYAYRVETDSVQQAPQTSEDN